VSRPRPLSGFPELLPEQRIVEQAVLDRLRETFERHGFASSIRNQARRRVLWVDGEQEDAKLRRVGG
jgi:hypothetical protein